MCRNRPGDWLAEKRDENRVLRDVAIDGVVVGAKAKVPPNQAKFSKLVWRKLRNFCRTAHGVERKNRLRWKLRIQKFNQRQPPGLRNVLEKEDIIRVQGDP